MKIAFLVACSLLLGCAYGLAIVARRRYRRRIRLGMLSFGDLIREVTRFFGLGRSGEFLVAETMRAGRFFQFKLVPGSDGDPMLVSDIPHVNVPREAILSLETHLSDSNWTWTLHEEEGMKFTRVRIGASPEAIERFLTGLCTLLGIGDTEVFNIAEGSATYRFDGID